MVSVADDFGQTPLFRAAEYGNEAVVELLLDRGGGHSTSLRDEDGRSPLLLAAKNGHMAVVKHLLGQQDIDLSAEDTSGRTAYSWAMEEGHEDVRSFLDEAISSLDGEHASPEQPPPPELVSPRPVANDLVHQATADEPLLSMPLVNHAQPVLLHTAQKSDWTPALPKKSLSKRPTRKQLGRQAVATAPLHADGDRTVCIFATIGERGSSTSVCMRRQTDWQNPQRRERDWNRLVLSATDGASPSATLSLTVRMTASAPQITVLQN
jgi:hypothetical protein